MKPFLIAVLGEKKSGKTTVIEFLTKELARRGYRVGAVKHIPEPEFTIDTVGKDTWKFIQAGASTVVAVSAHESATIQRVDVSEFSLEKIARSCEDCDFVFLEGFHEFAAKDVEVGKILIIPSERQADKDVRVFQPVIAMTGFGSHKEKGRKIPYVKLPEGVIELADLIEKASRVETSG